jgi:hypothetical protein
LEGRHLAPVSRFGRLSPQCTEGMAYNLVWDFTDTIRSTTAFDGCPSEVVTQVMGCSAGINRGALVTPTAFDRVIGELPQHPTSPDRELSVRHTPSPWCARRLRDQTVIAPTLAQLEAVSLL